MEDNLGYLQPEGHKQPNLPKDAKEERVDLEITAEEVTIDRDQKERV